MGVMRNFDFDFSRGQPQDLPYIFTKPVKADEILYSELSKAIEAAKPQDFPGSIVSGINASADSFYSSQGRRTAFPDFNQNIIQRLQETTPNLRTLEMETFHLYHLAHCWTNRSHSPPQLPAPPLTTGPVQPMLSEIAGPSDAKSQAVEHPSSSAIRAGAVQLIFAARTTDDFIRPEAVTALETWTGKAVLEALLAIDIPPENVHQEEGSVWTHSK
jgi:uridine phosphorylase